MQRVTESKRPSETRINFPQMAGAEGKIVFRESHSRNNTTSSPWLVCEHLPRVVVHRPEWHIGICSTIVRARDVTLTDSAFPFRYVSMRRVVCITRNAYPVTRELRRSPSSVIYSELLIVSGICDDLTFYTSRVTIIMGKNWNKNLTKIIWCDSNENFTNFVEREYFFERNWFLQWKKKYTALLDW